MVPTKVPTHSEAKVHAKGAGRWRSVRAIVGGIPGGVLGVVVGGVLGAAILAALAALTARPAAAQESSSDRRVAGDQQATIQGRVVDAETVRPLAGARVVLEPVRLAGTDGRRGTPAASPPAIRERLTDSTGVYVFSPVAPGEYRVYVDRPGYAPRTVDVEIVGGGSGRVTVGMRLEPMPLPRLMVTGVVEQPYPRTRSPEAERTGARLAAARSRREEHLSSDVRSLTAGEVTEAVTLGEPDLFRALQRMPGVGRRDDYTAVLWTRGADWSQTRVYLDGLPLYNPTHAGSLFSSISPNGVGAVTYHPGVRSPEWGEGAAGVLDLRTRKGGVGWLNGGAEMSLVSAQARVDGSIGDASYMLAGRRTHVDMLAGFLQGFAPSSELSIPFDFSDFTARVDLDVGPFVVEASGLTERDRLRGDIEGVVVNNSGRWGNRVGRVTLRLPLPWVEVSATRGATRFSTVVDEDWRGLPVSRSDAVTLPALENGIDHDLIGLRLESGPAWSDILQWAVGYEWKEDWLRYDGPFSLLGEGIPGLVTDSLGRIPFNLTASREAQAVWGDVRWEAVPGLQVEAGVRVEEGDSVRNGGRRITTPRVGARWQATPRLSFSGGWGRAAQYTQAIGASGGPVGPQLHVTNLWVLAGRGYPALQAEMATAGAELWLGDAWLLAANGYRRDMTGVTEPDPTPGRLRSDRSHVEGEATARGIELSARRLAGRVTGSLGYALARSEMRMDSLRYPAAADVRHSFDATLSYRFDDGFRAGAAFSAASGVPFTRVVVDTIPRLGEPNGNRTDAYSSLDLFLEYTGTISGAGVSAYLHLVNALGRDNRITYAGSANRCTQDSPPPAELCGDGQELLRDRFKAGLPRLPLVGVRIAF